MGGSQGGQSNRNPRRPGGSGQVSIQARHRAPSDGEAGACQSRLEIRGGQRQREVGRLVGVAGGPRAVIGGRNRAFRRRREPLFWE